jgi:medium-chain acyl-[acyl-carrier-protein] hydrolase
MRLLCFAHAGASGFFFRTWQGAMGQAIDVVPIHLPGHGNRLREAPFNRLLPLVDAACDALRPLVDRPFALFGHSVGAAIAFEIARRLENTSGRPAHHLFVAGRAAPDCPRRQPRIHHLPTRRLVAALRDRGGVPAAILDSPEALDLFMPILRADLAISETHSYLAGPPLNCPITVFGGIDDQWVRVEDLDTWARHTSRACDVCTLPGDHFFVATEREAMLHIIEAHLRPYASAGAELVPRDDGGGVDHLDAGEEHARARIER